MTLDDFITIERVLMVVLFACGWLAGWHRGRKARGEDEDGWRAEAIWWRKQNEANTAKEQS